MKILFTFISVLIFNLIFSFQGFGFVPPLPAERQAHELKVVTFNTWLLEIFGIDFADDIVPRRQLMVSAFNEIDADILSLREVWPDKHRRFLVEALSERYPYCSFDKTTTGILKIFSDGLIIFSKFPIGDPNQQKDDLGCTPPAHTLRFSQNTDRIDEQRVNKGAIHIVVHHPTLGSIDVYNSHFDALSLNEEARDYEESHKATSRLQALEFIDFVRETKSYPHQVLAIDINQHFRTWDTNGMESNQVNENYQRLISQLDAVDTLMVANNYDPETLTGVYTFDTRNNIYAADPDDLNRRSFEGTEEFMLSETNEFAPSALLDYIWYIGESLNVVSSELIFTDPVQMYIGSDERKPLSNHYGVMTTLTLNTP